MKYLFFFQFWKLNTPENLNLKALQFDFNVFHSDIPRIGHKILQKSYSTGIESTLIGSQNSIPLKNILSDSRLHTKQATYSANLCEYRFAALNINNGNFVPPSIQPPTSNRRIEEPGNDERKNIDTPVTAIVNEIMEKISDIKGDMDLPPLEGQDDCKEAAVMIEIRRLKMKKHKRKKLLKKMKFVYAKRKLRRRLRKEKLFQAELLAKIKEAEQFSAEQYVADKLARLKVPPQPKQKLVKIF